MTAVSATVVAGAAKMLGVGEAGQLPKDLEAADELTVNRFINLVFLLTGVLLVLGGVCRIGKLITLVPKIVISGFMNGIAIQIWLGEAQKVFGFGGRVAYEGGLLLNIAVTVATFAIVFGLPKALDAAGRGNLKKFLPSTLLGIVVVTAVCIPFTQLQHVAVGDPINSFSKVSDMFVQGAPRDWSPSLIAKALPGALNLLMLCYLDTLLTSLVMDQKVSQKYGDKAWRKTNQNFELMSQGVANGFCAMFGGLPGAQATIRSVLILNEGAKTRLAGCMVGVFVIGEMVALQSLIGKIPSAVFSGVLLKVGYDVLDWPPAWMYVKTMLLKRQHPSGPSDVHVAHVDMLFILGTTLVTVFVNLNVAVVTFTLLFFIGRLIMEIPDMKTTDELKQVMQPDDCAVEP